MQERDIEITKNRLDRLIKEYQSYVKELKDVEWKIVRKRKDIELTCNDLGIEFTKDEDTK